jgi:hypothetical protein
MPLNVPGVGDTFTAETLNQAIRILQQPPGGQELGHYKIQANSYSGTGVVVSCNLITLSRNSTPVSLSVDTSDGALQNMTGPNVNHLTQGGAQVYGNTSGAFLAVSVAGKHTMQY